MRPISPTPTSARMATREGRSSSPMAARHTLSSSFPSPPTPVRAPLRPTSPRPERRKRRQSMEGPMSSFQILQGKHAVVFGAGGSIGSAVAREFAAEGAEVFLSGRSASSVEAVARQIAAGSGVAHAAVIDAEDPAAVDGYINSIAQKAGSIDIVFNLVGPRLAEYG